MEKKLSKTAAKEAPKQSHELQEFIREVYARYDAMPLLPFVDVGTIDSRRIFYMKKYSPIAQDNFTIAKFSVARNCKKCYGMGYKGLFFSNERQFNRRPLLEMCACLREIPEEEKKDGKKGTDISKPKG